MKKVRKLSKKYEPTIADILDVVQTGFTRHDKMFTVLHAGQELLREELKENTKRLNNTQNRVEDVADMLEDVTQSTRKDRITIVNHEHRIQHLERASK